MNSKILKLVVAIISLLGIVGFVMVASAEEGTAAMTSAVNFIVELAFWLLVVLVVVTLAMSLLSLVKNPAALKKTLLGLVIFAVVLGVSYAFASDALVLGANGENLLEAGTTSKWSGAGLNFSLALLFVGGFFFVVDLLRSLIKS